MSQAASPGWQIRAGRELDHRYAIIEDDGVSWSVVREAATRFKTKGEAAVEQAEIVVALGISVAVVPASLECFRSATLHFCDTVVNQ